MQNFLFHSKPKVYGFIYLGLIPLYAIVFFVFPSTIVNNHSFVEYLYFSVVTITTLGYGDILPKDDIGRMIAASESLFGIIFIGLFLNALSRVRSETTRMEEIEKEEKSYKASQFAKLNGYYNLIFPLIGKYKLSVIQITSPLINRSEEYNPDFTLNDMKDLYGPSLIMTQDFHEPAVKYYFESLNKLSVELSDLVKTVDLRLFPDLEKHCLSFLQAGHSFDYSGSILSFKTAMLGDRPVKDVVKEMLDKHEGEVKFLQANMINGYVALYYQIKLQMELVDLIHNDVESVKSES